jgi:hypothetical protein
MIRVAVLVAALALPALGSAETIYRWEDSAGRLHYTNVRAHAPSYAEPLSGTIGTVRMQPLPERSPPERVRTMPAAEPTSMAPRGMRHHGHEHRGGCGLGHPFGMTLYSNNDPSELVKQVSVLDALGVRWRSCCD